MCVGGLVLKDSPKIYILTFQSHHTTSHRIHQLRSPAEQRSIAAVDNLPIIYCDDGLNCGVSVWILEAPYQWMAISHSTIRDHRTWRLTSARAILKLVDCMSIMQTTIYILPLLSMNYSLTPDISLNIANFTTNVIDTTHLFLIVQSSNNCTGNLLCILSQTTLFDMRR